MDLLTEDIKDIEKQLKTFAKSNKYIGGILTSAKNDYNVNYSIEYLLKAIIHQLENFKEQTTTIRDSISLEDKIQLEIPKKNCC